MIFHSLTLAATAEMNSPGIQGLFLQHRHRLAKLNHSFGAPAIYVGKWLAQSNPRLRPFENGFFLQVQRPRPPADRAF
jgi:hypothetical protein